MTQVETASESDSPRSVDSDQGSDPGFGPSLDRRTSGVAAGVPEAAPPGAKAVPAWLSEWRLKLALSSKVPR